MTVSVPRVRHALQNFELQKLFVEELGWDRHSLSLTIPIDGREFTLRSFAQKRGVQIFECLADGDGAIPDYKTRRRIEKQVGKSAHEHLIIFVDTAKTTQVWQWVARQPGQPAAYREHSYSPAHQSGDALIQKLATITIPLSEEEAIDLTGAIRKLRDAFDRDRVTKRFYDQFKREHGAFLEFIKGITAQGDKEWYASLMLNRLMFVYFIQKKGFLDGNTNYLTDRLAKVQGRKGKGKFHSFYRFFLLKLFHEGFSKQPDQRELDAELRALLGDVPYLNGGLFDVHDLERQHGKLDIPDEAFERLFAFFDQYEWHLDTRPLSNDREINPDVLGYIFEKYINQKQMGAYYTKEDITDYISKNTIIPYLFDAAEKKCAVAFEPGSAVWRLLRDDPDRYIFPVVRHGVIDDKGQTIPLPEDIAEGLSDVSRRGGWNRPATAPYNLPTETWREHIARRERCLHLRQKLADGEVHRINDLITYNLDVRQFAEDVVSTTEGPDLLRAFYYAIAGRVPKKSNELFTPGISVLDPTCGSGAFLFAALGILEPLYAACLERMDVFVKESEHSRPNSSEEEIAELISKGESLSLEFKSTARWDVHQKQANKALEHVVVKTVAAMLNTEGGDLLIGVDDDGRGFGVEHDYQTLGKKGNRDGYENWLTTLLLDQFGKATSAQLRVRFAQLDGHDVCRVNVLPSPIAVYVKEQNSEILYIRAGNSTRPLTARDTVAYHRERFERNPSVPKPAVIQAATSDGTASPRKFSDFAEILADVGRHPSRDYFILKSIVVHNLYGVDIMEEAVEICKLRLFLKLVAQIERVQDLEPLPDIDFNVRAGNTLVGFATLDDVKQTLKGKLGFEKDEVKRITEEAEVVDRAFRKFHEMQTRFGVDGSAFAESKQDLRQRLNKLASELDFYLAKDYGVEPDKPRLFAKWCSTHQPFHWFVEFFGIMHRGGFDAVIGNPPFVEYAKVRATYTVRGLTTLACGNLYTLVLERSQQLANSSGRLGLIVPLSFACTERMASARTLLRRATIWLPSFDIRPSTLFEGVSQRLSILLEDLATADHPLLFAGGYRRWYGEERGHLLAVTHFTATRWPGTERPAPKIADPDEETILKKISGPDLRGYIDENAHAIYIHRICRYFIKALNFVPFFRDAEGQTGRSEDYKPFSFATDEQNTILCLLNSSLFYWFWRAYGDGFHCGYGDVYRMPYRAVPPAAAELLNRYSAQLMDALRTNSERKTITTKKGQIVYQEFSPKPTKPILDEIDRELGLNLGFSAEELDFIINYDIKYRMGQDNGEDDE